MSKAIKRILTASATSAVLLGAIEGAEAGAFALREQSPTAQGAAFAGVAAGEGGLSSMYWNPATITRLPGWNNQWGFSVVLPYASVTPLPFSATNPTGNRGASGDIGLNAVIPSSYSSYQVNDWLWAGLSVNAPFGLATKAPFNWSGQVYGRTSEARTTSIAPTLAIKVNDWISFGASFQAMRMSVRLTSAIGVPAAAATLPGAPLAELKGNSWGYGFTAGVTLTPFAGTELGLGYRSQIREDLSGTFINQVAVGALPAATAVGGAYGIKSKVTLPDMVTVGLRQRVSNDLTFLAGFEWTHWGRFTSFPVCLTSPAPFAGVCPAPLALNFRYKDGWFASVGGEYKWNPELTLRAGLAYEKSPITSTVRAVRLPDSDRVWATVGAGYQISKKLSVDVSYAHIFAKNGTIDIVAGHPAFNGLPYHARTRGHVDILSAALSYRWDDPTVVTPGAPIVRKY